MTERKTFLLLLFLLLPLSVFAKSPDLDTTIASISKSVVASVQNDTIIAVLDFEADTEKLGSYIQNQLTSDIMETGKLQIVTRKHLDLLEKESDFQNSGYVIDETALSICQKLGAAVIVLGKIEELGTEFTLTVKMIGVETGKYLFFKSYTVSSDKKIKNLLKGEGKKNEKPAKITRNTSAQKTPSYSYYDSDDGDSVKSLALHFGVNRYSIDGGALCGGMNFNYGFNEKFAVGLRFGFSYDVASTDVTIFTIEPLLTARLYLKNVFFEAQGGVALANVDGEFRTETRHGDFNKYMICAAGEIGWRHYFESLTSSQLYLEPYIRAGTPFIIGGGVSIGIAF